MSIQVIVEDNNIELALYQLNSKLYHLKSSLWHKRRYGYFEKPSVLKRKRKRMKLSLSQTHRQHPPYHPFVPCSQWLKIELPILFARTGKNAMGR